MIRYFFLSLNVLNGLLAAAVAAVVYFAVLPVWSPVTRISLPPVKTTAESSGEATVPPQHSPVADYAVISDRNLFHPERKIPPEKQPEKATPKPEVFLYGTLITGEASYAFIEDKKAPHSTEGRGKRQLVLKKGASLGGYRLDTIEANRIVLVKGEEKVVVMLDDRGKKRSDESPAASAAARPFPGGTAPPPVKPASPQAMPSSAPPVVSSGPPVASPGPRAPGPVQRPPSQPGVSSSTPAMPPSAPEASPARPGIGASGTWPPTKSSIEQTRQKIQEGRQMREQFRRNP